MVLFRDEMTYNARLFSDPKFLVIVEAARLAVRRRETSFLSGAVTWFSGGQLLR